MIKIAIADDEQIIHDTITSLFSDSDYEIIHFYNTTELKIFMEENPFSLDLLLLDDNFKWDESGLEALPDIRELDPNIPIVFLTANTNPTMFDNAYSQNIEYKSKPIRANELKIHVKSSLERYRIYQDLQECLRFSEELLCIAENANLSLQETNKDLLAQEIQQVIPPTFLAMLSTVFPDIEFAPSSFVLLAKYKETWSTEFTQICKVLKTIDWKLKPLVSMRIQKFTQSDKKNVWEYRFSQAGRIFIQYRDQEIPLVLLIDPIHSYSKYIHLI